MRETTNVKDLKEKGDLAGFLLTLGFTKKYSDEPMIKSRSLTKRGSEKESLLPLEKHFLKKSITRNVYNGNTKMKRAGQKE